MAALNASQATRRLATKLRPGKFVEALGESMPSVWVELLGS